ncbi:MAG: tRNA pseudouridine(55) synthase TruB, partial [Chromatocurvus sp.]
GEERARTDASGITREQVEAAIKSFCGSIDQVPSMYSAIKHDGRPLYELARKGIVVPRKARRITVHSYQVLGFRPGAVAEVDVRVHCSKGTYIRSLAEDLGDSLGSGAHVSRLRRVQSGPFSLDDAVALPALESLCEREDAAAMGNLLLPSQLAIAGMPQVTLSESAGFYLRQGQAVLVPNAPCDGMVRCSLQDGEFLGIGEILDDGRVAPRRLMVTTR